MSQRVVIYNNNFIIIEKNSDESEEQFIERGYFIIKYMLNNKINLNEVIPISNIFINIKYNKCSYSPEIHKLLDNFSSSRV
jgi:hypothetical protein